MRSRAYFLLLLSAVIVAGYSWSRPGTSLCWVGEEHTLLQIQFSPYYLHRNRVLYTEIKTLELVNVPNSPEHLAIELATPRLNLIYAFASSDWVKDLPEFLAEIQQIVLQKSGVSCRFTWATLCFSAALLISLLCAVMLIFRYLKKPASG